MFRAVMSLARQHVKPISGLRLTCPEMFTAGLTRL
jgi:hypothetical protein